MDLNRGIKGEVIPALLTDHHAMRAHWGSGSTSPCIHDLGTI